MISPEGDGSGFGVHSLDDGEGLQMVAEVPQTVTAVLKALLNHNAQTLHRSTGGLHDGNQTLNGAAVGKKIIHNQHMVFGAEELFGHDDGIGDTLRETVHLGGIGLTVQIDGFPLLGEDHRYAEFPCHRIGDGNAGRLNGQHLGDGLVRKPPLKFLRQRVQQGNVHLVVQKAVHLQNVAGFHNAVLQNPLFQ